MTVIVMRAGEARVGAWRAPLLALGTAAASLLVLLWPDAVAMARLWWTSSTYEHCLLIGPISAWLICIRRHELAELTPAGWWPGVLPVGAAALIWLTGWAGSAAILRQGGLVLAVISVVIACLGPSVARGLAFPLGYLLFLVPVGEAFEQPLQALTARGSVALLNALGVANVSDGVFIRTHAGLFEVAEACSGVKFLVAMIAFGVLVAGVGFRSWIWRGALMAAAVALPIAANVVRATGTIVAAEWVGAERAGGVDHLVYGWIFFGLVIALLLLLAWPWFDRAPDAPWIDTDRLIPHRFHAASPWLVAAASMMLVAAAVAWSTLAPARTDIVLPTAPPIAAGWRSEPGGASDWAPRFAGVDLLQRATFVASGGERVQLDLARFADQRGGPSPVGYGQGATPPGSGWVWLSDEAPLRGSAVIRIAGPKGQRRTVAIVYAVSGHATSSPYAFKLATLGRTLLHRPSPAAAVLLSADEREGGRTALERFVAAVDIAALATRASGG